MADDPYAYLSGLSAHPDRAGDTSNLNPAFASSLANAIRQARAAGLPVGLMSGYRSDTTTGSPYDAGGNSSHGYGLASDISGLDGPNGKITQQWAQIAAANGLHNPYGVGNRAEFNHWQLPPQPLEQTPKLLAALKDARETGNFQNVWNAYSSGGGPSRVASATPISGGNSHADFILNYAKQIGVDPNLALGIANAEGLRAWNASNPNAASTVDVQNGQPFSFGDFQLNTRNGLGTQALKAGIDPRDPNQWQAADKFALDQMKAGGVGPWKGDPVAAAYLKSGAVPEATGPIDPSIIAHGGTSPPIPSIPGTTINSTPTVASGIQGFTKDLKKTLGLPDDDAKDGEQQMRPLQAPPAPGARNVSPLLGGAAGIGQGQVSPAYAQRMAALAQPMTWGGAPPGQMPGAGFGPQNQPVYGTSLMSQLQTLNNPGYMDLMAGSGGFYG